MSLSWATIATWLIVGSLAGALTGLLLRSTRFGYSRWSYLGIGLVGALIGGAIFRVLGVEMGLHQISVNLQDVVAAMLGSLLFLAALRIWRSRHAA